MSSGVAEIWDSGYNGSQKGLIHRYSKGDGEVGLGIKSLAWNKDLITLGIENGLVCLFDVRAPGSGVYLRGHKSRVLSLKWSVDKKYLASGDADGTVLIWDNRAGKPLVDTKGISKIQQKGSVKVSHKFFQAKSPCSN
jgi:cell division cycle protein 20 (cofactor of APC complex)